MKKYTRIEVLENLSKFENIFAVHRNILFCDRVRLYIYLHAIINSIVIIMNIIYRRIDFYAVYGMEYKLDFRIMYSYITSIYRFTTIILSLRSAEAYKRIIENFSVLHSHLEKNISYKKSYRRLNKKVFIIIILLVINWILNICFYMTIEMFVKKNFNISLLYIGLSNLITVFNEILYETEYLVIYTNFSIINRQIDCIRLCLINYCLHNTNKHDNFQNWTISGEFKEINKNKIITLCYLYTLLSDCCELFNRIFGIQVSKFNKYLKTSPLYIDVNFAYVPR